MTGILRKGVIAALMAALTVPALAAPAPVPEPVLPKAPREAAMTCYWATAAGMAGAREQTEVISEAVWYIIDYLHAEKIPGDTLEHIQKMSGEDFDTVSVFAGNPTALAAACRKRNPRNSAAAVALPADAFERDTLCMAVTSLVVGFARSEQQDTGRSALLDPATTQMDRIAERLSDETLAAHGYVGDEQVTALISGALGQATASGSIIGIYRACAAGLAA